VVKSPKSCDIILVGGNMGTLRDAVYGVAVGDALGSPVQFLDKATYPHVSQMLYCEIFGKEPGLL
jgi:hypothetical protein